MLLTRVLAPLLLAVVASGDTRCLTDGRCTSGATSLDLGSCGIADEDLSVLVACFDSVGRSNIEDLSLRFNDLSAIPLDLFDGFGALATLTLESNDLTLVTGNFKGAPSLESLDLSWNDIETLPSGAFEGLPSLRELSLAQNPLTLLAAGDFKDEASLEVLSLSAIDVETLPSGVFEGLESLLELDLSANDFTTLPSDVFDDVPSLLELNMHFNRFITFPADVLDSLSALQTLTLSRTGTTALPAGFLDGLVSLKSLSLNSNELTGLDEGTFQGTPALEVLDLGLNDLGTLPAGTFDGIDGSLIELRLESNGLFEMPANLFDDFSSLQILDLVFNDISPLAGDFAGATSLVELNLRGNEIESLPSGVFEGLSSLRNLNLAQNHLALLSADTFKDVPSLETLDLNDNDLSTLPAGLFDGLESLQSLDLERHDNLQCLPDTGSATVELPDGFDETSICECPEDPVCDEDGATCECQPGINGYSCAGSSSEIVRAVSCPSSGEDLVDARDRTSVDVDATGYDRRTTGSGCSPDGCVPYNTRDDDLSASSRWSCQGGILDSSDDDEGCCITYSFEEPQDIVRMQIAFHKGDERTRTLDVFDNGRHHSTITSSGSTLGYQSFDLSTDETEDIKLCLDDPENNTGVWLSITEVQFLVL